jgi:c-di-GMP-binding flagellar brake protein YcgR
VSEKIQLLTWPGADTRDVTMFIGVGLFFLALAIVLDTHRRRRDRKILVASERRQVNDLLDEREVEGDDRSLILSIIDHYAAANPYQFATRRPVFDGCMDLYFKALASTADAELLARRGAQLREIRSRLGLDYIPLGQRILSTRELFAGQTLWACPASGHEPRWFQVETVAVDEAFFYVSPVGVDGVPEFEPGDVVKFRLWREDDARYLFETRIYSIEEESHGWRVSHVSTLIRSQARAHYRIRFNSTEQISILNATLGDDYEGLLFSPAVTQLHGRITSLSGGGMAISFQQPMPKQMIMRVPFRLPGSDQLIVALVRPTGSQNIGGGRSLVRGRFVAMDDETRDTITRYVFLKQKQSVSDDSNR